MTALDDEVIDPLDLFWGEVTQDGFQDELVVVLVVEPCQKRLLPHELSDRLTVIPDDGALPGSLVFEHKKPIESKHLAVKDENIVN